MGNWLDENPELRTKEEVAKLLRCAASMVPRLKGLKKTRVGNGRGKVLYRKQDIIEYIESKVERGEVIESAGQQKERHRKMGVSSLISWQELQKTRMG
jgi:non-canonical (house-cleaning) NTP pyrophosphatase